MPSVPRYLAVADDARLLHLCRVLLRRTYNLARLYAAQTSTNKGDLGMKLEGLIVLELSNEDICQAVAYWLRCKVFQTGVIPDDVSRVVFVGDRAKVIWNETKEATPLNLSTYDPDDTYSVDDIELATTQTKDNGAEVIADIPKVETREAPIGDLTPAQEEEIVRRFDAGDSANHLHREFNTRSDYQIRTVLKKHGRKLRGRAEQVRLNRDRRQQGRRREVTVFS